MFSCLGINSNINLIKTFVFDLFCLYLGLAGPYGTLAKESDWNNNKFLVLCSICHHYSCTKDLASPIAYKQHSQTKNAGAVQISVYISHYSENPKT